MRLDRLDPRRVLCIEVEDGDAGGTQRGPVGHRYMRPWGACPVPLNGADGMSAKKMCQEILQNRTRLERWGSVNTVIRAQGTCRVCVFRVLVAGRFP